MPLGLNEKLKQRLVELLTAAIPEMQVRHQQYLSRMTLAKVFAAEAALPQTGKQAELIKQQLGDLPFLEFVNGTLTRELSETFDYVREEGPVPLTQLTGYEDVAALAERLVAGFESLPWTYAVSMPLPSSLSSIVLKYIGDVQIAEGVKLRVPSSLEKTHPTASGNQKRDRQLSGSGMAALLLSLGDPKAVWESELAYLQVEVNGFIDHYASTETMEVAMDSIKAFFGLALALRVLRYEWEYHSAPPKLCSYVHRFGESGWLVESKANANDSDGELHRLLAVHDLNGQITEEKQLAGWILNQMKIIGQVYGAGDATRNLLLAARWFWDSHTGHDELLQFVQCAVVVEILLGEKAVTDVVGVTELLANRCAYLIAKTHEERAELIKDFREIYSIRSKIVHNGKRRLSVNERPSFDRLKWICRRIIQEETTMLANRKKST